MAEVAMTGDRVAIAFSTWERIWTRRAEVSVPLAAIDRAACVDAPLRVARGGHRGLLVSGYTKIGVWGVLRGPRQLVSVRRRPALHLTLNRGVTGDRFDEIVLSHPDAARLTQRIRQAVRGPATPA
ncbi:hypothetical protein BKA00_001844 [Actinomadura coerulea]|uniref:Bacterial Pleckstrin homology domain-containing protein n=1 Tax=Actinomadura coerulea TaxID=46159 RepID=A0A7X0FXJ1_9ACTN|nr:hypothetical protein [Actinomadura coerulea]MBB6394930.1 hypothetical protein [Actinomadura coerulea]GGQ45672.1 hypothetical protein GCM10010187_74960 [Actinomadura coerulea]